MSLDAYEKALQSLLEFEQKVARAASWTGSAPWRNTHAKFVQDLSTSYINVAREVLK